MREQMALTRVLTAAVAHLQGTRGLASTLKARKATQPTQLITS